MSPLLSWCFLYLLHQPCVLESLSQGLLLEEPSLSQVGTVIILILQMTRPKLRDVETHTQFHNYVSGVPAFTPWLVRQQNVHFIALPDAFLKALPPLPPESCSRPLPLVSCLER